MFWAGLREAKGRVSRVPQALRDNDTEGGGTPCCAVSPSQERRKGKRKDGGTERRRASCGRQGGGIGGHILDTGHVLSQALVGLCRAS